MSDESRPERLNEEGFAALGARASDGAPVTMLNLLSFRPDGGRERYEEYGAATAPLLEKAGGKIVYMAEADPALLGDASWDMVLLVEYPSRQAFLEMIASAEYQEIGHLRTEALLKGELHPTDAADQTSG